MFSNKLINYKIIIIAGVICLCVIGFIVKIHGDKTISLSARSAIVMNMDNGKILYEYNKDMKLSPGSMTKIMSVYIALEEINRGNLKKSDMVTISDYAANTLGSKVGLIAGEKLSVDDLIKCVLIPSGSDAVVALAEHISGSEEKFVEVMNDKAKDLGLLNTHFQNCIGLDTKEHYSSAYDMALLTCEVTEKYPEIYEYTKQKSATVKRGDKSILKVYNTNDMLGEEGIDGFKTGSTPESGYSITLTFNKGRKNIVYVIMNSPDEYHRKKDCRLLLEKFS